MVKSSRRYVGWAGKYARWSGCLTLRRTATKISYMYFLQVKCNELCRRQVCKVSVYGRFKVGHGQKLLLLKSSATLETRNQLDSFRSSESSTSSTILGQATTNRGFFTCEHMKYGL